MRRHTLLALALGFSIPLLASAPSHAQATRTWVSGVGDDVNPCSRTAPCKTFAGAISKTFINGEINCLDPGGYGAVTITKSITIDCTGTFGSILASGTTGIIINATNTSGTDPLTTVRLRGLSINGAGASGAVGTRTGIRGINILAAHAVFIDDVVIAGFTLQGISDTRTVPGQLSIRNSLIRDNAGVGILAAASGAGNGKVTIENTHSIGNNFGVATAVGNRVEIARSVFSDNTTAGIEADGGASVGVDSSIVSHNGVGLMPGTILFSNSEISYNTTALSGPTLSFGNNRIHDNGSLGTPPTPIGQQ
jgi:hypothetical protein